MTGEPWIRIAPAAHIPDREGRAVTVGGCDLALFRIGERVIAVDGRCPHRGGPLADGIVAGDSVVCPLHGWKIGLTSGAVERPSGLKECVRRYATKIEDGIVLVQLSPITCAEKALVAG